MERITKQIKSHGSMSDYAAAEEEQRQKASTPREGSADQSSEEQDS